MPFWLAGGYGEPDLLQQALGAGAAGVQVGTAFAYCEESGLRDAYKQALLEQVVRGEATVFTDPVASPSGFPFKVVQLGGTISDESVYLDRPRICDLGYLCEAYRTPEGAIDFRAVPQVQRILDARGRGQPRLLGVGRDEFDPAREDLRLLVSGAAIAIALAGAPGTLSAQAPVQATVDVTGNWAFQVQTDAGTGTPQVTFKQDGEKLTGRYSSAALGEADLTGTVKGQSLEFSLTASIQGTSIELSFSGTIESQDSMKGRVSIAGLGEGTFTGKRK